MGQIFKFIGVAALAGYLFGDQVSNAIHDKFEYTIDGLRRGDIRFDFRDSKVVGLLKIRLLLKQTVGTTITTTGIKFSFRQAGDLLGILDHTELVVLPHAETVEIPLTVVIPASSFLDRLEEITQPGGLTTAVAPLEINGRLFFSNGVALPIYRTLNFLSIG